jgi:hypothetical protein
MSFPSFFLSFFLSVFLSVLLFFLSFFHSLRVLSCDRSLTFSKSEFCTQCDLVIPLSVSSIVFFS